MTNATKPWCQKANLRETVKKNRDKNKKNEEGLVHALQQTGTQNATKKRFLGCKQIAKNTKIRGMT